MKHKQFARTLVAWRAQNNYTQQEAADRLGVSRRSLENWEQERAMPQGFGLGAMIALIGVGVGKAAAKAGRQKSAKR